jgi:hypothetical protein
LKSRRKKQNHVQVVADSPVVEIVAVTEEVSQEVVTVDSQAGEAEIAIEVHLQTVVVALLQAEVTKVNLVEVTDLNANSVKRNNSNFNKIIN